MALGKQPGGTTVGTTSTLIADPNGNRTSLTITNLSSTATMYTAYGYPAVLKKGIVVFPLQTRDLDATQCTSQGVYAISTEAGTEFTLQEWDLS